MLLLREVIRIVNRINPKSKTYFNNFSRLKQFCRTMSVKTSPYGSWCSPISSKLVSESSVSFQEVHVDSHPDNKDVVFWTELRYDEGGRYIVCSHTVGTEGFQSWTPKGFNARTRVHEYGGGASLVYNGNLFFSNFGDQNMYKQASSSDAPKMVTKPDCGFRYADGYYNPKTGLIYYVREDHLGIEKGETKEAVNTVVVVNPTSGEQNLLVGVKIMIGGLRLLNNPTLNIL